MADIYGKTQTWGIAFPALAENVWLTTSGNNGGTLQSYLVQSIQCRYNKTMQPIREIGSGTTYIHTGPSTGTLSLSGIIGSKPFFTLLGPTGSNYWKVPTTDAEISTSNTITLKYGENTWKVSGCIVTNYSLQMSAQGTGAVMESAEIIFGQLEYEFKAFTETTQDTNDVFGLTKQTTAAIFASAFDCSISIAGTEIGMANLYQSVQLQYSQHVPQLRAITSPNYFYAKASSQGQLMLDMFLSSNTNNLGPFTDMLTTSTGGNPIIIKFTTPNLSLKLLNPVIINTSTSVSADSGYGRIQLNIGFSSLENSNQASDQSENGLWDIINPFSSTGLNILTNPALANDAANIVDKLTNTNIGSTGLSILQQTLK